MRLERLRLVVAEVEETKRALTAVVPTTRLPGTPLAEGIHELEDRLMRARELMPAWSHPDLGAEWEACDEGLRESLARAAELREQAPELVGFEGLIWAVDRLLEPLEPFEAAAERFRTLRR